MNILRIIYAITLSFIVTATQLAAPIPGLVNPGYLTVGLVNTNDNYVNFTTTNGVTTAEGFDVDIYCYIAQQLGLKIKFLGYAPAGDGSTVPVGPYLYAGIALNAGKIDCFGGADFFLANWDKGVKGVLLYGDYYGIVTSVYPTVSTYSGIAFLDVSLATANNLRCELLNLVEQAVDRAVATGFWNCALRRNNDNVPGAIDLTGNNRSFEPLISSTLGLIPVASSQAAQFGSGDIGCTACPVPSLPSRSCLVDFLFLQKNITCNRLVTMQPNPPL